MSTNLKLRARRGDIMALGQLTHPKFESTWFHIKKAKLLEEVVRFARYGGARGGIPRALVSEPRRHGKSLFCGELAPASLLGMSPDLDVMNTAYSGTLAGARVEGTKRIMNAKGWPFPVKLGRQVDARTGKTKAAKDLSYHFRTLVEDPDGGISEPGGSYQAIGISGGATGHGFHLGIADDWVKNEEDAQSVTMRSRRESFYDTCFVSGQEGDGAALLGVGTMWTKPDFLEWMHNQWVAEGYDPVWLRLPAIKRTRAVEGHPEVKPLSYDLKTEFTNDAGEVVFSSEDPREEGEGLWIGKFSTKFYERMFAGLLHAGNLERWAALWQQDPIGRGGVIFDKSYWSYYDASFDLGHIQELHFSADPNVKETGRSFGTIGVYGVSDVPMRGVQYFLLDRFRGHWDYNALRANAKHAWVKWQAALPAAASHPGSTFWVEDKANGPALLSDDTLNDLVIPFREVPKLRSKEVCYRLAAPICKDKRVRLPYGDFPASSPVTNDWVYGKGGFVEELFAQQPVREPNDDADQFAQMILCREPGLGPDALRL